MSKPIANTPILVSRNKTYDPLLRLLHWSLAISVLLLFITARISESFNHGTERDIIWHIHIGIGYVLAVSFMLRILWMFVGPKHARLSDIVKLKVWIQMIKQKSISIHSSFGHHPLASIAYLAFYFVIFLFIITGFGLAAVEHQLGPLNQYIGDKVWLEEVFKEPHEVLTLFLIGFTLLHLAALIWHEKKDGVPLAQSMISGYQYKKVSTIDSENSIDTSPKQKESL
jgi:Ni/Fe-hydrogenase 1 B-type cytochrome subunit